MFCARDEASGTASHHLRVNRILPRELRPEDVLNPAVEFLAQNREPKIQTQREIIRGVAS